MNIEINEWMNKYIVWLKKGTERSDQLFVTLYTLYIYPTIHNQLIRTLFEAHIVCSPILILYTELRWALILLLCFLTRTRGNKCSWFINFNGPPFYVTCMHAREESLKICQCPKIWPVPHALVVYHFFLSKYICKCKILKQKKFCTCCK